MKDRNGSAPADRQRAPFQTFRLRWRCTVSCHSWRGGSLSFVGWIPDCCCLRCYASCREPLDLPILTSRTGPIRAGDYIDGAPPSKRVVGQFCDQAQAQVHDGQFGRQCIPSWLCCKGLGKHCLQKQAHGLISSYGDTANSSTIQALEPTATRPRTRLSEFPPRYSSSSGLVLRRERSEAKARDPDTRRIARFQIRALACSRRRPGD